MDNEPIVAIRLSRSLLHEGQHMQEGSTQAVGTDIDSVAAAHFVRAGYAVRCEKPKKARVASGADTGAGAPGASDAGASDAGGDGA